LFNRNQWFCAQAGEIGMVVQRWLGSSTEINRFRACCNHATHILMYEA